MYCVSQIYRLDTEKDLVNITTTNLSEYWLQELELNLYQEFTHLPNTGVALYLSSGCAGLCVPSY